MIHKKVILSESVERLGYFQNGQVKLYGEIFRLLVEGRSVFVDAAERKSGTLRRIRIPLPDCPNCGKNVAGQKRVAGGLRLLKTCSIELGPTRTVLPPLFV